MQLKSDYPCTTERFTGRSTEGHYVTVTKPGTLLPRASDASPCFLVVAASVLSPSWRCRLPTTVDVGPMLDSDDHDDVVFVIDAQQHPVVAAAGGPIRF